MAVLTRNDFETVAGQEKIIKKIHKLEAKLYELENKVHKLQQQEELFEQEFQGPETY